MPSPLKCIVKVLRIDRLPLILMKKLEENANVARVETAIYNN